VAHAPRRPRRSQPRDAPSQHLAPSLSLTEGEGRGEGGRGRYGS
jgi:hypothetical protein